MFLILRPDPTWEHLAEAGRGMGLIFVFYLLPMLLIVAVAEGFGLVHWAAHGAAFLARRNEHPVNERWCSGVAINNRRGHGTGRRRAAAGFLERLVAHLKPFQTRSANGMKAISARGEGFADLSRACDDRLAV